jgi:plastocyanin
MIWRRELLQGGGAALLGLGLPAVRQAAMAATPAVEIHMKSNPDGSVVGFDPVGLLIEPGQSVRWICDVNVHTATAYHPSNGNHSLRIPEGAEPWNSDFLMPGQHYDVRLTVEGVYDYFCIPHEMAGMVGRLIVGKAIGPGTLPFDYFKARHPGWMAVPAAAQAAFPSVQEILQKRVVPSPLKFL